jgi:hypothetical protein
MAVRVLVASGIIFLLLFLATQVFIPAWHNRRLFPTFRKDRRKARIRLEEAKHREQLAEDIREAAQTDMKAAHLAAETEEYIEAAYDKTMDRHEGAHQNSNPHTQKEPQ